MVKKDSERCAVILEKIKTAYCNILKEKLTGIYVHGSIAFGCFRWEASDIDFLVIVNQELSLTEKIQLVKVLTELDEISPPKGLEMSVIDEKYCRKFIYPTPFALHYSNAHKESCKQEPEGYCKRMKGTDKDLAAHITVVRAVGITLTGKAVEEVFAPVPAEAYLDSIKEDIRDAVSEAEDNAVYIILNLCRVLAYVEEGAVLSKKQGGEWAAVHLPQDLRPVAGQALQAYCGKSGFCADGGSVRMFAEYMIGRLFADGSGGAHA